MVLTAAEQQELNQLRSEVGQQILPQAVSGGLTPAEQTELEQLRGEVGALDPTDATVATLAPLPTFLESAGGTFQDISTGLAAGVTRLPLGATQIATGAAAAVLPPSEGRDVAERFQRSLNIETNRLLEGGLDFRTAIDQARINVTESGIPDPSEITIGDVQRSQAAVGRAITQATEEASQRSPIATFIGEVSGEVGQLAAIGISSTTPRAIAKSAGLFGAISGGLSPNGKVITFDEDLKKRIKDATIQGLGGAAFGGLAAKGIQKLPGAAAAVADGISGGKDSLKRGVSKLLGINPIAAREFVDSGLANQVAAISDSNLLRGYDRISEKFPFLSGIVKKSTDRTMTEINRQIDRLGRDQAVTAQEAGELIQRGGERFISRFQNISEKLYNRLDRFIPPQEKFGLGNVIQLGKNIENKSKGVPEFQKDVLNSEAGRILNMIQGDLGYGEGRMAYEHIKAYRTRIGKKLSNRFQVKGEDEPILSQIYKALTEDMKIAAVSKGPRALREFDRANNFYREGVQKIENTIQKLIIEEAPERVFKNATSQTKIGDTRVRGIFKTLRPEEKEILRGTILNDLGKTTNGFSFKVFINDYNKISPEAKTTIFGKQHTRELDRLAIISKRLGELARFENPSGTAAQLGYMGLFGGTFLVEPTNIASGLIAGNIGARLLNNPAFTRWVADAAIKDIPPSKIGGVIKQLEQIAKDNPEIAGDILNYTTRVGIVGDSGAINRGIKNGANGLKNGNNK